MLEKPDLPDERLIAGVREAYGLAVTQIAFLPLGNDVDTAVYRIADATTPYFLKLRRGALDEMTVAVPHFLSGLGIAPVIAPIPTRDGRLWARVDEFTVSLAPFVAGKNSFAQPLSDRQWIEFGAALRAIHTASVPPSLAQQIPREEYTARWRDQVRAFQADAEQRTYADPVAAQCAAFLREKRDAISDLVHRAEHLAEILRGRALPYVLCHADIHAVNVLIGADGALHIVDWDTLLFAPKERDLMFIGAGIAGIWDTAREAALFSQGYGAADVDPAVIAYYRYERIVEDVAAYGAELLLTDAGGADRAQGLANLVGQFQSGRVVEIAYRTDPLPWD